MDKVIGGIISLVLIVGALTAMFFAWRARSARAANFVVPSAEPGEAFFTAEVFYVATTLGDNHLERVSLPGLAYRGYGTVAVSTSTIALTLRSGESLVLPRTCVSGVGVTTTVIDKVVEKDGLVTVRWRAESLTATTTELATHIRLPRSESRNDLLAALASSNSFKEKEGSL